ncbi:oxidoreductase, partial [candidate division KSB1 bacterium]|nr:oxidoreductase [candidate division KSB1 bacterium]
KDYISDDDEKKKLLNILPEIEMASRARMLETIKAKEKIPFSQIVIEELNAMNTVSDKTKKEFAEILKKVPVAYTDAKPIFSSVEKKNSGDGGLFLIFISDLCKGCGECVTECGEHEALIMVPDNDEVTTEHNSAMGFLDLLPDTPQKYLGLYNNDSPQDSKFAALRNHLMVRSHYDALVSGDGACAGCGEKSILRALASCTEAYMRPLYHAKAKRFDEKAARLVKEGKLKLTKLKKSNPEEYDYFRRTVIHVIMGLGGENDDDTDVRMESIKKITDKEIINAIVMVLKQEAFNHRDLQAIDGQFRNGMSVMAMGANTGCSTVYGSTPPNNPHPYPWMNSLFQDGATISWLIGESFIIDHARKSVIPERLSDALLDSENEVISKQDYFEYTHFTDTLMTDLEIRELPKVWAVGGDGGFGDIGYQNVSKVMLQNRPNINVVMLDTQVYSNTGGQNSDSSVMLGGFDMNQMGAATQGKLVEKKNVAETFLSGHGSPFVAQISMANAPKLYKAILDGLEYRGTTFFQSFTSCQPEHGVADDVSTIQAQRIRDSRGMPEFVFNPSLGETYAESLELKGNPQTTKDWWVSRFKSTKEPYQYTVAHWCATEARFRKHMKKISQKDAEKLLHLETMLVRITQDDVVNRRFLQKDHRSFVPDFGVYMMFEDDKGNINYLSISRQLVLFCVERRKAWRLL